MRQKGFSLVEMMVALTLGMIVIGASLGAYTGTLGANSSQMKYSKLNNELRTVMTRITRDMRRAGYKNWISALSDSAAFPDLTNVNYMTENDSLSNKGYSQNPDDIDANSATISYDLNSSGTTIGASDSFGYAWTNTDRISGASGDLTDPSVIRITNFTISTHSTLMVPCGAPAAVTVPVYEINISGQLVSDPSVQRSIRETVRIRNSFLAANNVACP